MHMNITQAQASRPSVALIVILFALLLSSCRAEVPAATPTPGILPSSPTLIPEGITVPGPGESPTIDKIRKNGKLRAGVAIAAPWLLQDPNTGEYFGPAIEITKRIAELLNVEVEYVPSNWDVIIAGIQADKFDIAVAPLFATPQRKEVVDFVTYTVAGTCYAVLKENAKVNSLDDLNNPDVKIITFTGTGTEQGIKAKYPKATIVSVSPPPGAQIAIEDVLVGRVDVAPFDSPLAVVIAKKYPQVKIIPGGPEDCINNPDIPFPIGMAFQKGDTKMAEFLQIVVNDMQEEINQLILKYSQPEYLE
jgi:polar amino acid transport system substrate-binding protein